MKDTYYQGSPEGDEVGVYTPWKKISTKSQRGDQGGTKGNFWTKFRNVSFGPPFETSTEFRQKSLKIMIFVEKNSKQNFGDFAKNCPLNRMSLSPSLEFQNFSGLHPLPRRGQANPAYYCQMSLTRVWILDYLREIAQNFNLQI